LRVLQEREIDRLGGAAPVKVNVRVLATSNRDLLAEVGRGTFREDLYFRLNVIALAVPPLRARPADIVALSEYFAHRFAQSNGLAYRPISQAALRRLAAGAWRGNVRELENTIHRAVLLAAGDVIDDDAIELPCAHSQRPQWGQAVASLPSTAARDGVTPSVGALVGRTVSDVERDLILETLHHTLGNRTHAATLLGISIRSLRNKLNEYAAGGAVVTPPGASAGLGAGLGAFA